MMPSEWAMEKAKGVVRPLKDRIYRELSAENYDSLWDRVAAELDATRDAARAQGRREGLEEAAIIVATAGRYVYAQDTEADIRRRIALEPKV